MALLAENFLAGANTIVFDYCADMHITDLNNGEQFLQLEVFIIMPEPEYGMFVMNEPVAINKWMIFLVPEDHEPEDEDDYLEFQTYAFETSMDCLKVPPKSAVNWSRKAMKKRKNISINTSRPLSCYLYNVFLMERDYSVPLEQ